MLFVTSALPLRASPRAQPHAKHVQQQALKGCPVEGGEKLTGSEAMTMYEGSTSDESGSTCARAGENGLDRAALDVASAEQAPVPGITMPFAAPDATKGGVDEEEAAQSFLDWASWRLFQFLAILVEVVLGLLVFGRVQVPRRSSAAKGAAWRLYVIGYLLISPQIALAAAAATSVRGSDYAITKSSKIKTNESPSSSVQSLEQRRVLSGYVMTDSNIRTAVAAWLGFTLDI